MRFLFLCLTFAFSGCATVKTIVISPLPKNAPVAVISDRPLDDWKIHNLIIGQMHEHGLKGTDGGDAWANPPTTAVRYFDEWRWDVVMYPHALRLRLLDGKTGAIYSTADYQEGIFHGYPSSDQIVRQLFKALDEKGAFEK